MIKKSVTRMMTLTRSWNIPDDNPRRYMYDIWQPLILLVSTTSITATFYATSSSYS
jgi:hypothetical protein